MLLEALNHMKAPENCVSEWQNRALGGGHESSGGAEGLEPTRHQDNRVPISSTKVQMVHVAVFPNEIIDDSTVIYGWP